MITAIMQKALGNISDHHILMTETNSSYYCYEFKIQN
jgi:hypothetical protein